MTSSSNFSMAFLTKTEAIRRHARREHPAWEASITRILDAAADYFGKGATREEMLNHLAFEQHLVHAASWLYGEAEYLDRMLSELRTALYTREQLADLEHMAAEMAELLEADQPTDPTKTMWEAFDALLAAGDAPEGTR